MVFVICLAFVPAEVGDDGSLSIYRDDVSSVRPYEPFTFPAQSGSL